MLINGFQPHALTNVKNYRDELQITQDFLRDMEDILHTH